MLLAEAGYTDPALVEWDGHKVLIATTVPDPVCWRAFVLDDPTETDCWPCWSEGTDGIDWGEPERGQCGHDPMASPWPEVVR